MTPFKVSILRYIATCEERAQISGPKALATLATVIATVGKDDTQQAIKELHNDGLVAIAPSRTRTANRFLITETGKTILAGKVAA